MKTLSISRKIVQTTKIRHKLRCFICERMTHLQFKKYTAQDFNDYYALVCDETVMEYITGHALSLEEAHVRFKKSIRQNDEHAIFGSYRIFVEDVYIGFGMVLYDTDKNEAEIGYMIFPRYFKKGYGQQIANALVALARQTNVQSLIAMIDPKNKASRKILTRAGFASVKVSIIDGMPTEIFKQVL